MCTSTATSSSILNAESIVHFGLKPAVSTVQSGSNLDAKSNMDDRSNVCISTAAFSSTLRVDCNVHVSSKAAIPSVKSSSSVNA